MNKQRISVDLYKDGEIINVHFNADSTSTVFSFSEEAFKKFKATINRPPYNPKTGAHIPEDPSLRRIPPAR